MVAKTTRKKKTSDTVKQELLNSIKKDDNLEEPDINATADTIKDPLEAIRLTQRYKKITKTYFKKAEGYVGKQ